MNATRNALDRLRGRAALWALALCAAGAALPACMPAHAAGAAGESEEEFSGEPDDGDDDGVEPSASVAQSITLTTCNGARQECEGDSTSQPYNCRLPNTNMSESANRYDNVRHPTHRWAIAPGTVLYDGYGASRGTLPDTDAAGQPLRIKLNNGQRKSIPLAGFSGPQALVYAFAVPLAGHPPTDLFSGWVRLAQIEPDDAAARANLARMRDVTACAPPRGYYRHIYRVTGGSAALRARYERYHVNPRHVQRCAAHPDQCTHEAPTDYLERLDGVVNLLFALPGMGGVSTDTYRTASVPLFRRARRVRVQWIPIYTPTGSRPVRNGPHGSRGMPFVYGFVRDPGGARRYGWIARDALR